MKTVKTLSGVALGIQLTAFVLTILICICQESVKLLFTAEKELQGVKVFPVGTVIGELVIIGLYLVLFIFACRAAESGKQVKTAGIVLFILMCVWNFSVSILARVETIVIAAKGYTYVASLSVVSSAISLVTGPLNFIAFGLFAMAIGAAVCVGKASKE